MSMLRAFSASQLRSVYLPIAAIFLVSRCAIYLIVALTALQVAPPGAPVDSNWMSYLCRWDCGWYLGVAHGYSAVENVSQPGATNFGFYPMYPLLIRWVAPLFGGNPMASAIAISNVCCVAALIYVYRYARILNVSADAALLAIAFLCFLPQSIVFSAGYSESLFLLLLAAAMFHLRKEQFLLSGIAAALLSAARPNGVLFVLFALAWNIRNFGFAPFVFPWRNPERFVPIVLAPLGLLAFWAYSLDVTGDAFAHPSTEVAGWGWYFAAPWQNVAALLRGEPLTRITIEIGLAIAALSVYVLARQKLYEELVLSVAFILLVWAGQSSVQPSIFRYWLVLFPVWIALARSIGHRPVVLAVTIASFAVLNGALACAWTMQWTLAW